MTIQDRYPEDDATTIYLLSSLTWTVDELLEKIKEKWGDVDFSDIVIRAEYIHTRCIGYDLYDGNDYDEYLILERIVK